MNTWSIMVVPTLLLASTAAAQVGYPPTRSPFRDIEDGQHLTFYSGYYLAAEDPVGVAPRSGPLAGARYDVRIGGPMQFAVQVARVWTERTIIDPDEPPGEKTVGVRDVGLYLTDVGLSFNLTGQKSWRHLVPVLGAGLGIASDFRGSRDVGDFRIGTPFAISAGGGVRWVPPGPVQVRVDVLNYWYQIRYPDSYFDGTTTNPPVRTGSQSVWTRNLALTLGASIPLFR